MNLEKMNSEQLEAEIEKVTAGLNVSQEEYEARTEKDYRYQPEEQAEEEASEEVTPPSKERLEFERTLSEAEKVSEYYRLKGQVNPNDKLKLQDAFELDAMDLRQRYDPDLVDRFAHDFRRGNIKTKQEEFATYDNIHEVKFVEWCGKQKLNSSQIKSIVDSANEGRPLRSRSKQIIAPNLMHPEIEEEE